MKDKLKGYLDLVFSAVLLGAGVMIGMALISVAIKLL